MALANQDALQAAANVPKEVEENDKSFKEPTFKDVLRYKLKKTPYVGTIATKASIYFFACFDLTRN